ncbi:MAG: DUF3306 domain-containing protein, partial [Pseudomonadota bacterium]
MSRPDSRDDGFLGRWSRLKREGGEPAPAEAEAAAEIEAAAPAEPPKSDAEVLEELGLPEPEMLEPGDDFAAFMKAAVPEHLRRRALRRLWTTNPVLANLDELVDYGEDFTDAATVVENLATAWKVGRGYDIPEPEPEPDGEVAEETAGTADADDAEGAVEPGAEEHGDTVHEDAEALAEAGAQHPAPGNPAS